MAWKDFSQSKGYLRFNSNEQMELGRFKVDESGPITALMVGIYVKDYASLGGNESIVIKFHSDASYSRTVYTSSSYKLSNLPWGGTAEGFLGRFPVTIDNYFASSNKDLYISATISNYTQNGDTHYVAIPYDYPTTDAIYEKSSQFDQNPLHVEIYQELIR